MNETRQLLEFDLPQASISRIVKSVLPESVNITKDARAAFARAAAIFVFYITHCANDLCKDSKRQTIYTQDVLNSLKEIEFEEFVRPLEEFLEVYRRELGSKKAAKDKGDGINANTNDDDDDFEAELVAIPTDNIGESDNEISDGLEEYSDEVLDESGMQPSNGNINTSYFSDFMDSNGDI